MIAALSTNPLINTYTPLILLHFRSFNNEFHAVMSIGFNRVLTLKGELSMVKDKELVWFWRCSMLFAIFWEFLLSALVLVRLEFFLQMLSSYLGGVLFRLALGSLLPLGAPLGRLGIAVR